MIRLGNTPSIQSPDTEQRMNADDSFPYCPMCMPAERECRHPFNQTEIYPELVQPRSKEYPSYSEFSTEEDCKEGIKTKEDVPPAPKDFCMKVSVQFISNHYQKMHFRSYRLNCLLNKNYINLIHI